MLQYSRRHGRKSGTVDAQPLTQHQRIENNIRSLERKNLELQAKVKELLRKAGDKQHYTTRKRREFLMEARPYINRKAKNINLIRKFRRLQDRLLHARLKSLRSRARLYAETVVGLLSDPMTLEKDVASDSAMPPRRTERAIIDVALGLASIRYLELDEALEIAPSGAPSDAHIAGTLIAHASAVAGIESPSAITFLYTALAKGDLRDPPVVVCSFLTGQGEG